MASSGVENDRGIPFTTAPSGSIGGAAQFGAAANATSVGGGGGVDPETSATAWPTAGGTADCAEWVGEEGNVGAGVGSPTTTAECGGVSCTATLALAATAAGGASTAAGTSRGSASTAAGTSGGSAGTDGDAAKAAPCTDSATGSGRRT